MDYKNSLNSWKCMFAGRAQQKTASTTAGRYVSGSDFSNSKVEQPIDAWDDLAQWTGPNAIGVSSDPLGLRRTVRWLICEADRLYDRLSF